MNNCANSYPPRFSCLAGGMLVGFYSDCKVGPRLAPAALTPLSSPPSPQVVQTCRRSLMMFGMEITIQYFKFWPSDSEFIRILVEGAFWSPSIVLSIPNIAKHLLHVCLRSCSPPFLLSSSCPAPCMVQSLCSWDNECENFQGRS